MNLIFEDTFRRNVGGLEKLASTDINVEISELNGRAVIDLIGGRMRITTGFILNGETREEFAERIKCELGFHLLDVSEIEYLEN